jgi:hypothetical protein
MLKAIAAERGVTISKAVTLAVTEAMWHQAFLAERRAQQLDNRNPAAVAEDAEWDRLSDEAID